MMKKFALVVVAAMVVACSFAKDMEEKAKVVKTLDSVLSGPVEITCDDLAGWTIDANAVVDNGRDVIVLRLSSPVEAQPPKFGVFYRVSGVGVQNVWVSNTEASDGQHLWPRLWWGWVTRYSSQLSKNTPIAVGYNATEVAPISLACSEASEYLMFGLYSDDATSDIIARCEFFQQPVAPRKTYTAKVMLDRRGVGFADAVRDCTQWVMKENGFKEARVPESAYDPLYSTWYAYLQDVHDKELEKEAEIAHSLGMKTMILDDGWQKEESVSFYSAVGDWQPVKSRFADMKDHVAKVHKAGLKYMPWLAVPYVGDETRAWGQFKDKLLYTHGKKSPGKVGVLDPRFPEVREYLISTYERVLKDWGFDGLKLDFIDAFHLPEKDPDPAIADNYAGRDYKSVPEAVNRLMKDVNQRLCAINPDVLIEFRQNYMGPAILQYGNMMRVADCPADPCANRKRMCDLRLTSGKIAVHSDMLVWSKDESAEGAALPILNVLYSTIQYSMILNKISPIHKEVIRHWLKFSQEHRSALLKGSFTPHHPENGYTWIESEDDKERVVTSYANNSCVNAGKAGKTVYLVNATGTASMLVNSEFAGEIELFDTLGKKVGSAKVVKGVQYVNIPNMGYGRLEGKQK